VRTIGWHAAGSSRARQTRRAGHRALSTAAFMVLANRLLPIVLGRFVAFELVFADLWTLEFD